MRSQLQKLRTDQRGIVLVMALMLMGLMAALASSYAIMVRSDTILRGAAGQDRTAFYAAEAGLNKGMAEFGNMFSNYQLPTGSDFSLRTTSFNTRTVNYQLSPVVEFNPCPPGTNNEDCFTRIPPGERFAGLNTIPYVYRVRSTSLNGQGDKEAELGGEFTVNHIPIFQFLAFFSGDLEIQPALDMTGAGRVHTNSDMYLAPGGGTTTIRDQPPSITTVQVSAGGRIYRKRKETGACSGSVQITPLIDADHDNLLDGPPLPLSCPGSGYISASTIANYQGAVADQVTSIEIPAPGIIDRGTGNLYWDRADLRIVLRLDQSPTTISFGAADLCPGNSFIPAAATSPALYPIEVQNADGSQNTTKTRALWRFMCERRGSIFYNDVPTDTSNPNFRTSYNPNFLSSNDRVYRRAGEDTNGDGIVDYNRAGGVTNSDRNDDVCPISNPSAPASARPWWAPDDCPWPHTTIPTSSWFRGTDYRRGGFLNKRENKWMYLLNVNIRALIDWNGANSGVLFVSNDTTDGGLIFHLSVQGPNSNSTSNNYGVRVFDSADLNTTNVAFSPSATDPTGLTIVSDQAVYVQGNYNSRDWAPAAVLSDSINVLSQAWETPAIIGAATYRNDHKSSRTLSSNARDVLATDGPAPCGGGLACGSFSGATSLQVNAAFISGVDNTVAGGGSNQYGGGLQNYPRMHEDWNGRTLNYLGSFVSLGTPRRVNGIWCCNGDSYGRYNPPTRNWSYDARFEQVQNLPPLTPKFTYVQQRMYTRFYQ